jgi:geranylgeranyl reductase family protein
VRVHDVLVVGAGPGGSATAHFLSRKGFDVVLLDRAEFPRDKTCGDGLTPRALRVLERMGILAEVAANGCRVDRYEVVAPAGRSTTAAITGPQGGLVVPRLRLDNLILDSAVASGVCFEPAVAVDRVERRPHGVTVHAQNGQRFDARAAVIATGAATAVLKRSGILKTQPRAMLAARAYFEDLEQEVARTFQLRFDQVPLPGYGWIFPIAAKAANVGVGFLPGRRRYDGTAGQAFDRFVSGPALGRALRGARQVGPVKGYPIRTDFLEAPTFAERTLLVGEAAGLVNPLTGEGIDYALESGSIAADHLTSLFEAGELSRNRVAEYHGLLHDRFEKVFQFSEWIRDWYCKPTILNLLVPLANRRPELRQLLASLVLGEREPRGYGPVTMLGRLLIYLARHP